MKTSTHAERVASTVRSIAIAQEAVVRGFARAARAMREITQTLRAWDNGATPEDRACARRYLRAAERSRRNQPPGAPRKRRAHGRPR